MSMYSQYSDIMPREPDRPFKPFGHSNTPTIAHVQPSYYSMQQSAYSTMNSAKEDLISTSMSLSSPQDFSMSLPVSVREDRLSYSMDQQNHTSPPNIDISHQNLANEYAINMTVQDILKNDKVSNDSLQPRHKMMSDLDHDMKASTSSSSDLSSSGDDRPSKMMDDDFGGSIGRPPKKQPVLVPDQAKDAMYWEKRVKNNESAKRSRENRRMKEEQIALRVVYLEQDNLQLRTEVSLLKSEIDKLRCMLYNS